MVGWLSIQTRMRTNTAKEYVVTKSVETEFRFVIYFFVTFFVKSISQKCNCPHVRLRANKIFFSSSTKRKKIREIDLFFSNIYNSRFRFRLTDFITTKERRHPFGKLDWKAHYACLSNFFTPIPSSEHSINLPPEVLGEIVFSEVTSWPRRPF